MLEKYYEHFGEFGIWYWSNWGVICVVMLYSAMHLELNKKCTWKRVSTFPLFALYRHFWSSAVLYLMQFVLFMGRWGPYYLSDFVFYDLWNHNISIYDYHFLKLWSANNIMPPFTPTHAPFNSLSPSLQKMKCVHRSKLRPKKRINYTPFLQSYVKKRCLSLKTEQEKQRKRKNFIHYQLNQTGNEKFDWKW